MIRIPSCSIALEGGGSPGGIQEALARDSQQREQWEDGVMGWIWNCTEYSAGEGGLWLWIGADSLGLNLRAATYQLWDFRLFFFNLFSFQGWRNVLICKWHNGTSEGYSEYQLNKLICTKHFKRCPTIKCQLSPVKLSRSLAIDEESCTSSIAFLVMIALLHVL